MKLELANLFFTETNQMLNLKRIFSWLVMRRAVLIDFVQFHISQQVLSVKGFKYTKIWQWVLGNIPIQIAFPQMDINNTTHSARSYAKCKRGY